MATTTTNLGLTKPALSESADVGVINDNSDKIDAEAGKARANLAAEYNSSSSYSVGAYCERGGNLYRCTTAIGSGGEAWNASHWTQVAVTGEIPKVIDNLASTSASAALSAKQGKTVNDRIGTLSSLSTTQKTSAVAAINEVYDHIEHVSDDEITSLENVPVNTQGRITLANTVNPYGSTSSVNFVCFGNSAYRTLIVSSTYSNTIYMNSRHNSTSWKGWKQFTIT